MPLVKSKYKNPDRYIERLKAHEAEAWGCYHRLKSSCICTVNGEITFVQRGYDLARLLPEEIVFCRAQVEQTHAVKGESQVTLRFTDLSIRVADNG